MHYHIKDKPSRGGYPRKKERQKMWWMINAEGERVFAVESKKEAEKTLDNWLVSYIYVG